MFFCRVFEILVIWKSECVVSQTFSRWYYLKIKSILTVFVCNHNPIKFDKVPIPAGWNANHDRASSLLQRAADTPVTTDFQSGSCITWHTSAVQLFLQFLLMMTSWQQYFQHRPFLISLQWTVAPMTVHFLTQIMDVTHPVSLNF